VEIAQNSIGVMYDLLLDLFGFIIVVGTLTWLFFRKELLQTKTMRAKGYSYYFRWYYSYGEDNLFLAYTYLSLTMMRQDADDLRTQQSLLIDKLHRRFGTWTKSEIGEFYFDILKSYPKPDMPSLFLWLNQKSNDNEKIHILDVLADLAYHNNIVTTGEFKFLYHVAEQLHIPKDTIRSIIAIRQSRVDSQQRQSARPTSFQSKESIVKRNLHVLGLNHAKSQDEIKQAYRKLAKLHHPDLFAKKSKSEQDMANERFIEIKAAYDYLVAHFS
jgi:DnaJ like chaperone protein